jgi:hypothetical protein
MTGAAAFHPFYGDDGQQIGWQSADGATVLAMDQLPADAVVPGPPSPAPTGGLLDLFAGSQAQAAPLPPGFEPVPYETKGKGNRSALGRSEGLPEGFEPVPYAEHPPKGKAEDTKPDRDVLGSINNFVGGVSDAAAMAVPFADEAGAAVRALARGATNLIQGKDANLGGTYDRALADIRGRDRQFSKEHPVAATVGSVGGGLAALPGAGAATARSLPAAIARSGATGAGYGGISGFAAGEGGLDNRLEAARQGATVGGGLGAGVPLLAGPVLARVISPVRNRLTPEQQRLAQVAQTEGVPLTAAQATGSRPLQSLESVFGTLPMTAGPQQAVQQAQRSAFNQAALRHIGEAGDSLAPEVLERASQRIGGEFKKLAAQTTVNLDPPLVQTVDDVFSRYADRLEVQRRPIFEKFVNDIRDAVTNGGVMKGTVYQTARSDLSRMAKSYGGTDPTLAEALRGLRDALDDAADRSMPTHLKGDWDKARLQYGNLRTLEKAMSNTTTGAAAGNLQPTQLAQAVKQQHPRAYGYGAGPMNDLSRVGNAFVRDQIPNSGTPERSLITSLLTGAPVGAGGTTAYMGNPLVGAAVAGAGLALPRVAQGMYNSRLGQRYFKNQASANTLPQINQGLLQAVLSGTAGGGLLGQ